MDLMQLKAPPDRVRLMADAIQFCIEDGKYLDRESELTEILAWLRYRLARWDARNTGDLT